MYTHDITIFKRPGNDYKIQYSEFLNSSWGEAGVWYSGEPHSVATS